MTCFIILLLPIHIFTATNTNDTSIPMDIRNIIPDINIINSFPQNCSKIKRVVAGRCMIHIFTATNTNDTSIPMDIRNIIPDINIINSFPQNCSKIKRVVAGRCMCTVNLMLYDVFSTAVFTFMTRFHQSFGEFSRRFHHNVCFFPV